MLLAALDQRRPTRDVDLLATAVANDVDTIAAVVRDIAMIDIGDGVVFDTDRMTTRQIRERDLYAGVRVMVPATVDRAQQPLRVDVNVGDPVTPAPQRIAYPALLGEPFELIGYPIETVLAEKLVTMVALGEVTTRERDFADVLLLTDTHAIDAARLSQAITATAAHRQTTLRPLREATGDLGAAPGRLAALPDPRRTRRQPPRRLPDRHRAHRRVRRPDPDRVSGFGSLESRRWPLEDLARSPGCEARPRAVIPTDLLPRTAAVPQSA